MHRYPSMCAHAITVLAGLLVIRDITTKSSVSGRHLANAIWKVVLLYSFADLPGMCYTVHLAPPPRLLEQLREEALRIEDCRVHFRMISS